MFVHVVLGSLQIFNVPLRVRLRFAFTCGFVHNHFVQSQDLI